MGYKIKLDIFEGPFDLLFHLIEKNEIDIYDIPIAEITRQYLDYLYAMEQLDLEITSEFLVMAATLLSIKAKMLLPRQPQEDAEEEEGVDPREELVERLLEYKKYKQVAGYLERREKEAAKVYPREINVEEVAAAFADDNPLEGVELTDLLDALVQVMARVKEKEPFARITREEITIRDKVVQIQQELNRRKNGMLFSELFSKQASRVEIVVTFLALLELMRLGKVLARQSRNFGDIYLYALDADGGEA
ncbi:MAG: segregation/condensation protein A [Thermoanaerobacteraceae bacterium]|nr:segregation/condensation protein A [Thermoanaerobacteraceae bacterium]